MLSQFIAQFSSAVALRGFIRRFCCVAFIIRGINPHRLIVFKAGGNERPDKARKNHSQAEDLTGGKTQERMGQGGRKAGFYQFYGIAHAGVGLAEILDKKTHKAIA